MLNPGTKFGSYEVRSLLGVGGIGPSVARLDTKLQRGVALKILPEDFASDADRSARFERDTDCDGRSGRVCRRQETGANFSARPFREIQSLMIEV